MSSRGRSIDSYSPAGKVGVCAFAMVFILVGLGIMKAGLGEMQAAKASADWPQTSGKVFKSSVEAHSDSDSSTTWHAQVAYTYSVDGTEMKGNRVSFGDYGSGSTSRAQHIVNTYPVGMDVKVYYDPNDPAECLLEPGMRGQTYFLPLFGFAFFAMGSLFCGATVRSMVVGRAQR